MRCSRLLLNHKKGSGTTARPTVGGGAIARHAVGAITRKAAAHSGAVARPVGSSASHSQDPQSVVAQS